MLTKNQQPSEIRRFRNSAKAIIIDSGRLLVTRNQDEEGDWFLLPGGGQLPGETLPEALQRECLEEVNAEIEVGSLLFVREYLGKNHEFARNDSDLHQIELMFRCRLLSRPQPGMGSEPDEWQTGIAWLPLDNLGPYRLYPSQLKRLIPLLDENGTSNGPVYIGDVN